MSPSLGAFSLFFTTASLSSCGCVSSRVVILLVLDEEQKSLFIILSSLLSFHPHHLFFAFLWNESCGYLFSQAFYTGILFNIHTSIQRDLLPLLKMERQKGKQKKKGLAIKEKTYYKFVMWPANFCWLFVHVPQHLHTICFY